MEFGKWNIKKKKFHNSLSHLIKYIFTLLLLEIFSFYFFAATAQLDPDAKFDLMEMLCAPFIFRIFSGCICNVFELHIV